MALPSDAPRSVGNLPEAPYPREIRARGWRFEFDTERIKQSDTWAIAGAELRPWLLMLWMTAWENHPIGLPGDERAIAGQIGMPLREFQANREVLLRGWKMCADGRLYHSVLTERVMEMVAKRTKDAVRMRKSRSLRNQEHDDDVTRDSDVTAPHVTSDSHVSSPEVRHPPPTTQVKPKSNARSPRAVPPSDSLPAGFLRFWAAYPNRNGRRRSRKDCLALWHKQGLEGLADAIVSHVEAMKRTAAWLPNADGESYEWEALRYLRRRNWEDGLPSDAAPVRRKAEA